MYSQEKRPSVLRKRLMRKTKHKWYVAGKREPRLFTPANMYLEFYTLVYVRKIFTYIVVLLDYRVKQSLSLSLALPVQVMYWYVPGTSSQKILSSMWYKTYQTQKII